MASARLAVRIVNWQRAHGRNNLPWQNTGDPYRVWLSEIMLQQTQVSTVIGYYQRFLTRFSNVLELAQADIDEVLVHWAGLGYYARARNLHACAQTVVLQFEGQFPRSAAALQTLPGIGASTAAAIAAFCYGERATILDGNVKRVMTRHFAIDDEITQATTTKALWQIAQREVPTAKHLQREPDAMARYTQGLMDLGATVCLRSKPKCDICPLRSSCAAFKLGRPEQFPVKVCHKKDKPIRDISLLWLTCHDHVLLEKRPTSGVWGGLWCLPTDIDVAKQFALGEPARMASFAHELTHFRMVITTWRLSLSTAPATLPMLANNQRWVALTDLANYGLPKPIAHLLANAASR